MVVQDEPTPFVFHVTGLQVEPIQSRRTPGGVDVVVVLRLSGAALLAVAVTSSVGYVMNYRLATATETALAALRVRAFRHIHDLSLLHHATEHRGALVSRVTADVDTISQLTRSGSNCFSMRSPCWRTVTFAPARAAMCENSAAM